MMKALLIILFILSAIPDCCYSSDVKFHSVNTIYGISMREINSICKDENGFIWASSKSGILRITDGDYRIYQLPYKTANVISTRVIYANSQIIVSTNNGQLFLYDELYDGFKFYLDLRTLLNNNYLSIGKIIIDNEQTLWIPTSIGLYRYRNGQLDRIGEERSMAHSITECDENHILIASEKNIEKLNIHSLNRQMIHTFTDKSVQVSSLFYDKKKEYLWLGTFSDGLFYYDMNEDQFKEASIKQFPKQPVWVIEENSDSSLFVGIDGQGVWELTREGNSVLNIYKEDVDNSSSLRGDGVYDIFCDEKKRVWVATYSGGLSYFEQESPLVTQITHQINNSNSLGNNNINKVLEDSRGNFWFATNNGISHWKVSTNQWSTYYKNTKQQAQVFLTLCEDDAGNIWAGSYSSGFYILEGNTGKELMHYTQEGTSEFSGKFIYDIFKDSDGDMWIGGLHDVICYLTKKKRFRLYANQPVRSLMEFSPGKMLLACTYGLLLLDKQNETIDYLLTGCLTQDVLVQDSNIWVGTGGDGLICYNYKNRTTEYVTTTTGLPSNYVTSIIHADGFLWVGTENGLCQLDLANRNVSVYPSIFALSNASFNVNSDLKLKNGNVMWGTNNGAVMFNPNTLNHVHVNGRIFFQDISISGRSIREIPHLLRETPVDKQTEISLKHDQNTIVLELLPIGISSSEIKFSWKMEGLDADWNHPSNLQIVTYTNISSRNLQLKIRMYDSSLSQIIDERVLNIHVIPPYWETWWFYLIISIILISIFYFSMRFYLNRLKQRHAEDKIRFFANTAHDIRTSLTLISAPIEELIKEQSLSDKGQYYLELAIEQTRRLSSVATQLLDFQKVDAGKGQLFLVMADIVNLVRKRKMMFETTAGKNNIELIFQSDVNIFMTAIDEVKMEKVVDNLISNAIKYSYPNGKVEIRLTCHGQQGWTLEVKDYGFGISDNAKKKLFREFYRGDNVVNSKMVGSGIGLLLVKSYVIMHQGSVFLESKEHEGTSFKIVIPHKIGDESPLTDVASFQPSPKERENHAASSLVAQQSNPSAEMVSKPVSGDSPSASVPRRRHVLIAEDNNDLQNFLRLSLQDQYHITIAGDGLKAWDLVRDTIPDLIISDIMMPNMDGFELCRLIKSTFETSHIPVILLTALSEKAHQLEGLGLGADDYITKPFDLNVLSQRMISIVRNREIVREKALRSAGQINDVQPILANEHNDQFIKKALGVIQKNMDNSEFDKNEFAIAMHVSASLLYKKIKALTGQSPIDFIKTVRLNHALELLQSRQYNITEVSELCGFASISYFSTVFKKHFGKSPIEI